LANSSASCPQDDGARIEPRPVGVDRGHTNRKTLMTSPAVRNDIQIERIVCAAICEEIGDRLRIELADASDPLPRHMAMLVEQMVQSDRVSAYLATKALATTAKPLQIDRDS
jgi:hypothetical protein